jgi:hypothetical protein
MANLRTLTRKTTAFSATQWLADSEDADALVARGVRPADTVASALKLQTLGEIFPTVALDIRRDVLAAADFRVDMAAVMLGDLVREETQRQTSQPELCFHDLHGEEALSADMEDEDDWSEVAGVSETGSPSAVTDQWVVVQDEWEVLDQAGDRVRSFAEVLQSRAATSTPDRLPTLSVVEQTPVKLVSITKQREWDADAPDVETLSVKSFGARRRHLLKHRRR